MKTSLGKRIAQAARARRYQQTEKGRKKRFLMRTRWKSEGRCINCGSRELSPGKVKCEHCREICRLASKRHVAKERAAAYQAYGGPRCVCCGETEPMFMTIDHINGGGSAHRRQIKTDRHGSPSFYRWLKRNNYPPGFQVMCQNCNVGKWRNGGVCPHKK